MFSAGADSVIKHFDSSTGRVLSKALIPDDDAPSTLYTLSPHHLLVGCDSGALHLYDVRESSVSARPARTTNPHGDAVSSINPVPPFSDENLTVPSTGIPKQWVTTGGSTLAVSDLRAGKEAVESEDQEDDLLCAAYLPGTGRRGAVRDALAVGGSTGVVTLWDRGSWDDQQDRMVVDREESVDVLVSLPPGLGYGGREGKAVFAATGDGRVTMLDIGRREAVLGGELRHDDVEAVVGAGFDCFDRLVTGGGKVVKIWEDLRELQGGDDDDSSDEEEEGDDDDDDDDSDDEDEGGDAKGTKREREESSEEESDSDEDSDEERGRERRERERKRREAVAAKLGPMGAHGVLKFEGLD